MGALTVPDEDVETPVGRAPAIATAAERGVLGAVMRSPTALTAARLALTGGEFYHPRHEFLWAVICDLADAHTIPDVVTVVAELGRRGKLRDYSNGVTIVELEHYASPNLAYHLTELRNAARVRAIDAAHTRLGQHLEAYSGNGDMDTLLDNVAHQSIALTLALDAPVFDAPVPGVQTWEMFTVEQDHPRWIVQDLIRRHDTIMVLGGPGVGKSYLSRQVAMCLAAGIHPFKLRAVEPVRTLLVDLENAPDQVAEEATPMLAGVKMRGQLEDRGWVWMHPEGFNLRKRVDAQLLERVIAQTAPDVLCMGSLYNAYRRGRDDWDTAAEDVQTVLKELRSRYQLGLWLEHHMPRSEKGGHTGTPYGGTMWERWPTHGRRLSRVEGKRQSVYLFEQTFRGDRGARELPLAFTRGGSLPLTAIWEQEDVDYAMGEYD